MSRICILFLLGLFLYTPTLVAQITISGTVTDCENEVIPGVNIVLKKKKVYAISGMDGTYQITVPDSNAVLQFSFLGYKTQRIRVKSRTVIDVSLTADTPKKQDVIVIAYKPLIYLYPEYDMDIDVRFSYNGTVLVSYPEYGDAWRVRASPTGLLQNKSDNKEYSYLFWEGARNYSPQDTQYAEGFVVARDSTATFLQRVLPSMGLLPKEYNEFIVYWMPQMLANAWNFVYFRTGKDYNLISQNLVSPKPDVEIRVFMEFKAITKPFEVRAQSFRPVERTGFTLVEWGGSCLNREISVKNTKGNYISR
jgi:hypothetical protein